MSRSASDVSGVVSYGFDSYEDITTADSGSRKLSTGKHVQQDRTKSGDLIDSGMPAYKIVTSENWSIVFPLTEEDAAAFMRTRTGLRVVFSDYSMNTPAAYSTFTGKDGAAYGKLDFTKYMEQFISDRFVNFEIVTDTG
ncbi:MAG: HlyD family efflux transporter periplasmic adaptor subunit [Enterocloster bolteae]